MLKRVFYSLMAVSTFAATLLTGGIAQAVGTNLISNPSAETSTTTTATGWLTGFWGTIKPTFSVKTGSAADGQKSLYVSVASRSSGDAKWYFAPVAVTAGTACTYSDMYKSNVSTQATIEYTSSTGSKSYVWLSDYAASPTAYQAASVNFTIPAGKTSMTVFHLIATVGWVETDSYSLTCGSTTPPPAPVPTPVPAPAPTPTPTPVPTPTPTPTPAPSATTFSRPLVSIEFDDGWLNSYQNGAPIVESYGFRVTDYVITGTTTFPDYMNETQMKNLVARGHDLASHTVTHPHLPRLGATALTNELKNSDTFLTNLLGKPNDLFATSYCETSSAVIAEAKKYYTSLRNCDEDLNRKVGFDAWNLRSIIVLRTTTDAQIQSWINKAKSDNAWLVLVYHEVKPVADNDWSITPTNLSRQLQMVKNSGLTVVKTGDALAEIRTQL